MFSAGSIQATMGLDARGFFSAMSGVESVGKLFPSFVQSFLGNPLLGLADVIKGTGRALVAMTGEFIEFSDEAGDLADSIGQPVEYFSQFAAVLGQGKEGLHQTADAFKFLNTSIAAGAAGNKEHLANFARIGVSMKELRAAAGTQEQNFFANELRAIANVLATFPDGAAGAAVLQKNLQAVMDALAGVKDADAVRAGLAGLMAQLNDGGGAGVLQWRQQILGLADAARGLRAEVGGPEGVQAIMAKAMDGMKNMTGVERTRFMLDEFGRSGLGLIEKMSWGWDKFSERQKFAAKVGASSTAAQVEQADQYKFALEGLGMRWTGLKHIMGGSLLNAVLPELDKISVWADNNGDRLQEIFREIGQEAKILSQALGLVGTAWMAMHPPEKGWLDALGAMFGPTDQDFKTPTNPNSPQSDQAKNRAAAAAARAKIGWFQNLMDYTQWGLEGAGISSTVLGDQHGEGLLGPGVNNRGVKATRSGRNWIYNRAPVDQSDQAGMFAGIRADQGLGTLAGWKNLWQGFSEQFIGWQKAKEQGDWFNTQSRKSAYENVNRAITIHAPMTIHVQGSAADANALAKKIDETVAARWVKMLEGSNQQKVLEGL